MTMSSIKFSNLMWINHTNLIRKQIAIEIRFHDVFVLELRILTLRSSKERKKNCVNREVSTQTVQVSNRINANHLHDAT